MTDNLNDPQGAWDSESRRSPYSTVADTSYEAEHEWGVVYEAALARGATEEEAVAEADAS